MIHSSKKVHAIHSKLREEILSGAITEGEKLPVEHEIAERFECSLGTVNKAVALLVHEGLVTRRARIGTTVLRNSLEKPSQPAGLDAFAFIYPGEEHPGVWRLVRGFNEAARQARRRVVMLSAGLDYKKEGEYLSRLSEFDVRGAAILPVLSTSSELIELSQLVLGSKFPLVLAEVNLPGLGRPAVVVDGFHAGYTMAKHMIARGAGKIGFFSNYSWTPFMRDRYQGYRWALREAGMAEPENGVFLSSEMHPNFEDPIAEPTQLAEVFLKEAGTLDAVVCAGDFLALGCIRAAEKLGMSVPNDLLVSGIDGYLDLADQHGVALTTYRIPFEAMGRASFDTLQKLLHAETPRMETQVQGDLIQRETA